jgi:hypothetical protein
MRELGGLLHGDAVTVTGRTVAENVADAPCWNREVIHSLAEPFQPAGTGTAVLRGNLAPDGAVIKQSAASAHLLKHRGRALVFDSPEAYYAVVSDPDLDADENTVLVIRYCGPRGYPGMPEVSNVPLPAKLLRRGVRDMVRICDGRMSGTAYGTVVLHVAPEAAAGGPLALVRTGDWVTLDVPSRLLTLEVADEELDRRRAEWNPLPPHASRGWTRLYTEHVQQASDGADLDFLVGGSGHEVGRESHLPGNAVREYLRDPGQRVRGLWSGCVRRGVAGLVDGQFLAVGQADGGQDSPALVGGFPGDLDALAPQVGQRGLDVVAHQVELVTGGVPVGRVHGQLGRGHREDEPAAARVDRGQVQDIREERAHLLRLR